MFMLFGSTVPFPGAYVLELSERAMRVLTFSAGEARAGSLGSFASGGGEGDEDGSLAMSFFACCVKRSPGMPGKSQICCTGGMVGLDCQEHVAQDETLSGMLSGTCSVWHSDRGEFDLPIAEICQSAINQYFRRSEISEIKNADEEPG